MIDPGDSLETIDQDAIDVRGLIHESGTRVVVLDIGDDPQMPTEPARSYELTRDTARRLAALLVECADELETDDEGTTT